MAMANSILRFRFSLAAIIFSALAATAWYFTAPTFTPDASSGVELIADKHIVELLDHRNAATRLHREAFSEQVTVAVSAIATAIDRRGLLAALFLGLQPVSRQISYALKRGFATCRTE